MNVIDGPPRRALITDMDGTIYNWTDFFAPSFRAMVHVLARVTLLEEERLIQSFREVYVKYKSVEYPFVIQELDIWRQLNWSTEEIQEKAVKPARVAFRKTRDKHLQLYPNVRETLKWIKAEGLLLIAYTDAPAFQAEMRLKVLRVDYLFDDLFSWDPEFVLPPPGHLPEGIREKQYRSRLHSKDLFSLEGIKPNPSTLKAILEKHRLELQNVYMVGDSLWKDIGLAQALGVCDIWARYGKTSNERNRETMKLITPWTETDIDKNKTARDIIYPSYTIDDFAEITSIIGSWRPSQLRLFP
jgi:FMN phosphatase YigB (HAD superfamily)